MSSNITLSAATRQNLLSLQGTADLLATTQNRLATNKKVNSALDNPTNFFTADGLSSRSSSLSNLLDGISNGIQTIQAANTGLTKLQGLTDQLKSVAQQAQASSNAFTSKATSSSIALTGATAANLLSTGPTKAVSDTAIGASSPTPASVTAGTIFTGAGPTVTGTAFTLPAQAQASTVVTSSNFTAGATGDKLTFSVAGAAAFSVTIDDKSLTDTIAELNGAGSFSGAGLFAEADGTKLKITNRNGSSFTAQNFATNGTTPATTAFGSGAVQSSLGGSAAGTTTVTIAGGAAITISGGTSNLSLTQRKQAVLDAINAQTSTSHVTASLDSTTNSLILTGDNTIGSFTVSNSDGSLGFGTAATTIVPKTTTDQTLTINGQDISIASGSTQAQAIAAINAYSATTGVSAANDGTTPTKIKLSGATDGGNFTVRGSVGNTLGFASSATPTTNGVFSPTATSLATSLGFATGDTFSVNGQSVSIASGETLTSLAQKVTVATNGTVSAAYDETNRKFNFTAADSSTGITLANGSTGTALVSNLGYSVGNTTFAAGLGNGTASSLKGTSLTVTVGSGTSTSFTFGSAAGQISTLTQLNAALAPVNAQASIDSLTGKITITTTNDFGADNLTVSVSGGTAFASSTNGAIIGGDGAAARRSAVVNYNNLLNQINQLAADASFNGLNLLAGDSLKVVFNERGTSLLSVQGSTVNTSSLGLGPIDADGFQENGAITKVITTISSASAQLKTQASSLGSNLAVVQNRQDFTKQIINVLDTGAGNLVNADLNEEAANSQALSTRNSLGISALSLANTAQQAVLQLLR
jgi:hypothetical protein